MKMRLQAALAILILNAFLVSFDGFVSSSMIPQMKYESIINFGDSLSDTGNSLAESGGGSPILPSMGQLPYGQTFFGRATGRASDGRLIIDFIAEAFGLPFVTPYMNQTGGSHVKTGVNFAVSGATALDAEFYHSRNLGPLITNDTLSVQVEWFKKWKTPICTTKPECISYFNKSLFLVGEIGGNDYNYFSFIQGSVKQVQSIAPFVVEATINATTVLIEEGAVNIVVRGSMPLGCVPAYLTRFQGSNQSDYNPVTGCLDTLNEISKYHNKLLVEALDTLQKKYPNATISYADYYGTSIGFYDTPKLYGFSGGSIRSCCGGGGRYNFNISSMCGLPGSTVCNEPSTYVNWDGMHWTEAAYRYMANGLIHGRPLFTSTALKLRTQSLFFMILIYVIVLH